MCESPRLCHNLPGTVDARSHLQLPQQPRRSSFQEALQKTACRMRALGLELRSRWRAFQLGLLPPCKKKEACPSDLFLGILPLESKPDSFQNMSHPPPSLTQLDLVSAWACSHELSQLRAEIATLQETVRAACWT